MRRCLVVLLVCLSLAAVLACPAGAATVYVSPSGSDARAGTDPALPWRTLGRVGRALRAGALPAGSQILLARGMTFPGTLTFAAANAGVTLGAYGTGRAPVIRAGIAVTGWTAAGAGRWRATCATCTARPAGLTIGGAAQRLARWPNADAPNGGYRAWTSSSGATSLTDPRLTGDWVGADVVVRSQAWVLDALTVRAQTAGGRLTFDEASYPLQPGYGYFLQNDLDALDRDGEWVYDAATKTITVQWPRDPGAEGVVVTGAAPAVTVAGAGDVTLRDVELSGGSVGLAASACRALTVTNVTVSFSATTGVDIGDCRDAVVSDSRVTGSLDLGIDAGQCAACRISRSSVTATALFAGMGANSDGHYNGVLLGGAGAVLQDSVVDGVGYLGVDIRGPVIVRRNVVRDFNRVKVDGGGIYTWRNTGAQITDNLVTDAPGSPAGIPWGVPATHGIYIDDNSQDVTITGNTIARVGSAGINLHNTRRMTVTGNTIVDPGESGIAFDDDDNGSFTVTGSTVRANTIVTARQGAVALRAQTTSTPPNGTFLAQLGTIDANMYCDVFTEPTFFVQVPAGRTTTRLSGWRARTGQDAASRLCAYRTAPAAVTGPIGPERVGNGTFDGGIAGWFGWPDTSLRASADAGALRVAAAGPDPIVHIDTPAGAVTAGTWYRVKVTARGAADDGAARVYLRQAGAPYAELTPSPPVWLDRAAASHEFFLRAERADPDALLIFELPRGGEMWLDDVSLRAVPVRPVAPADVIRLLTNPTGSPLSVTADRPSVDPAGVPYPAGATVTVPPYGSVVLLRR